jgi:hypothetical protein
LQVSPLVQALPSEHAPLGSDTNAQAPVWGLQESTVHASPSLHTLAVPAHNPAALQKSLEVHASPSEQSLPGSGVLVHAPVMGLQVSAVQLLASPQFLNGPGRHVPL